jgi:deoxyribonuclease V
MPPVAAQAMTSPNAAARGESPDTAGVPLTDDGQDRRFAAVDVYYPAAGGARAALVLARDPAFSTVDAEHTVWLDHVADYQPGRFYERELPALRAVLDTQTNLDLVVVDGYVHLDPHGRPGLGAHLNSELCLPVIGVAKTPFRSATHAIPVVRGRATRPLYVTAAGIAPDRAAALVQGMAGPYRIPEALRRVDALSRSGTCPARPAAMPEPLPSRPRPDLG